MQESTELVTVRKKKKKSSSRDLQKLTLKVEGVKQKLESKIAEEVVGNYNVPKES